METLTETILESRQNTKKIMETHGLSECPKCKNTTMRKDYFLEDGTKHTCYVCSNCDHWC